MNKQELKSKRLLKIANDKKIKELISSWVKLMAYTGNYNQKHMTYILKNIEVTDYGYSCRIFNSDGLNLFKLEDKNLVEIIQGSFGCTFVTKYKPKSKYLDAKFIMKSIDSLEFKPIRLKPWELFFSMGIDGKPLIADMLKYPHVLVQGATNSGKTCFLDIAMVNLIATESSEDVHLYIAQSDKSDQIVYRKCKHCKAYADKLEKIYALTNYLVKKVEERDVLLQPYIESFLCKNIFDYNKAIDKKIIKAKKFTYDYLIIDEYASLMPDGEHDSTKKTMKQKIQDNIERLIQIGRSSGLYILIGTQRATVDKLPSFIKAMSNTIVSFRVNNRKSSEVALDSDEALVLEQREFITKQSEKIYGKTVTMTPEIMKQHILPHRTSSYVEFNFNDYMHNIQKGSKSTKSQSKKDTTKPTVNNNLIKTNIPNNNDNVPSHLNKEPTKDDILVQFIKNTPGYIPFNNKERTLMQKLNKEDKSK